MVNFNTNQAVCVTRFDQSECVICIVIFIGVYGDIFALFQAFVVISTLYGRGTLLEHLILIVVTLLS